ncbi:3-octaprenyl-4-hydroxybenzoate carboxy-lyase [Pedobacter quisquiliarum]|uniref:3-octaprenyl-4-hydroxybenzoate carboxy-lyase n=1 Tax=Pedobacter quisquiliarum TaxID=1834438 RepID=A0A916UFX5_9SPHI|nr:UbiD family decarboxylase [Pedobacter quisquiliarum]GGC72079.1 3-octaprenyl-4-hydroxybenzoate carboxy-lyase [Pedobacter quisquiliarum]
MGYSSLAACVNDLEKHGHLIRIKEEVDPYLEMASIHLRVYEEQGPAILFENVKGSKFPAVSNLFGTLERSKFMFRDSLANVEQLVGLRSDPIKAIKNPFKTAGAGLTALSALPLKQSLFKSTFRKTTISALPQIVNWPMDGGPFITMPQVYTEDVEKPGILNANLGMYRIQLAGNAYIQDQEIGLHYQIHRGIGVHQSKANKLGKPLKVSIFVGGPPSHPLAAVMPLPEGLSEMTFAGALGNRRFRYFYDEEGFCISADADFVITGTVYPNENKPEGPFGDHLGYYSLTHPFPLMKVHNVYHREDAIWSFTVVGRPPQEDTSFGALIHEITGSALPKEIHGLKEVNAVDAAGVHPLLFAIGSERYTPFLDGRRPQEILTISNHILGKNQLSLAKYLFIAAREDDEQLSTHHLQEFLMHVLSRMNFRRDLHFHTQTTIDTLDYTGTGLNAGSKVVFAAAGPVRRSLQRTLPAALPLPKGFSNPQLAFPGVLTLQVEAYTTAAETASDVLALDKALQNTDLSGFAMIVLCDDSAFTALNINNFVWVTFTRSNPAADIYGIGSATHDKHWGCEGPIIIDARKKPHHAPELIKDPVIEANTTRILEGLKRQEQ